MTESGQHVKPSDKRACSVDSASTCLPLEGPSQEPLSSHDPLQCSISSFTRNVVACLKDQKGDADSVYTQAEIQAATERALAQQKQERGSLLLAAATVVLLLATLTGGCSLYSAIKLSERPPKLGSPGSVSNPSQSDVFVASTGNTAQFREFARRWRGSTFPSGALMQIPHTAQSSDAPSSVNSAGDDSGIYAENGGTERMVPLSLLASIPFEALIRVSVVVLRLNDNEVRAYRVATVSRNFSTNSTAMEFASRETLVIQPDGLALLLTPSNAIVTGWNVEPQGKDDPLSSLLSTAGGREGGAAGQASPSESRLSSFTVPLTNAQVTEWLLRKQNDLEASQSSSIGQPIEDAVLSGSESSTSTKAPSPAFPLTDKQYEQMDKGEPLLEGFPALSPSTNVLNTTKDALPSNQLGSAPEPQDDNLFLQSRSADPKEPTESPDGSTSQDDVSYREDGTTAGNAHTGN
ncbi:putative transmembrane protein [Toxoplasma gondii p89]|uniref:Putative transmembrane protein n=1 Tax=Toxoplasma gondii p89 TaxID=943119 RepID=A0A086L3Y1_TOXGO|nr:putative transmembrane protein [Toxoplasma gondii p89]